MSPRDFFPTTPSSRSPRPASVPRIRIVCALLPVLTLTSVVGCAGARRKPVEMAPMQITDAEGAAARAAKPPALKKNHFKRDRSGAISEHDLRRVLSAPVFLEKDARIGVVPVNDGYNPDNDLPLDGVPGSLTSVLGNSAHFEGVTEVSTDWPSTMSISGLRELAARYRADYLLLYRHRFVDDSYVNPWAFGYLTVIGAFFLPANTLESNGVLEATLFDVKTGTLLFTVFERTSAAEEENIWQNDRKHENIKNALLEKAAEALGKQVVEKVDGLAVAREKWLTEGGTLASPNPSTGAEGSTGSAHRLF